MTNVKSIELLAAQMLQTLDGLIDRGAFPEDVRKKKFTIIAKRVAGIAKSAKTLEEFCERLLKEIAGDALFITHEKAKAFKDVLEEIRSNNKTDDLLRYIKEHPYLSVVNYAALRKEE